MDLMKNVVAFLEENVNGRTLYTDALIYTLEDGALQGVYADQISFSNLKYSQTGCQLDMFIVSNEKIYQLGKAEKDKTLRKDFSSVSLFRFELAARKSAAQITGFFRFVSASGKNVPAEAIVSGIYDVHIKSNMLSLKENQCLYRDQPIADGEYKPVAFESVHTFTLIKNKLHYKYDGESFDVNPATMERQISGDAFPPFVSIEK